MRVIAPLTRRQEILGFVRFIMLDIAAGLNAYSSIARELDEEYMKYSTEKAFVLTDTSKTLLELPLDLDDATDPTDRELDAEKPPAGEPPSSAAQPEPEGSSFLGKFFGKKRDEKQAVTTRFSWKEVPQAFTWCFDQPRLRKSLKMLSSQIDDLEMLGPYLVASLDQNSVIRRKLETPESGRAFRDYKGHLLVQKEAERFSGGLQGNYLVSSLSHRWAHEVIITLSLTPDP